MKADAMLRKTTEWDATYREVYTRVLADRPKYEREAPYLLTLAEIWMELKNKSTNLSRTP